MSVNDTITCFLLTRRSALEKEGRKEARTRGVASGGKTQGWIVRKPEQNALFPSCLCLDRGQAATTVGKLPPLRRETSVYKALKTDA